MRCIDRALVAIACVVLLGGCVWPAPRGEAPPGCSGVPGDDTPPPAALPAGAATHGPGGSGQIVDLVARARPSWGSPIPLLYVFDGAGRFETRFRNTRTPLVDPVFRAAEQDAFWYEGLDDGLYEVPELGQCEIAAVLGSAPSFRAPDDGLLFFQFVVPDVCDECDEITGAIERFVAAHPDMPVRWVRVMVPRSVGKLRVDEDS